MQFLQQLFKKNKNKEQNSPTKQKSSWITSLCSSKPNEKDQKVYISQQKFQMENSISKNMKLLSSSTQTSATKQHFKVSFKFEQQQFFQLQSDIINIVERNFSKFDLIMKKNQLYGLISSQKDPLPTQVQCLWLKIGKNQQINSLIHIQSYRFQKIFMIPDQLGFQYSIQQIISCNQTICVRLKSYKQVQHFIEEWEKQLKKSFAFRSLETCFNKLTLTIYKIGRYIWLNFNQPINLQKKVHELLEKVGFHSKDSQYSVLMQQIPKGLTLHEYLQILKKKEKLQTQYQGDNSVKQFLRHKFLQKMSRSRRIYFQNENQEPFMTKFDRSNTGRQYADYFNAINNTQTQQAVKQFQDKINEQQKEEQQDEIFNFHVYKDESQQQIKGVAIQKSRKNRSKSEEITNLGKQNNYEDQQLDACFYENE